MRVGYLDPWQSCGIRCAGLGMAEDCDCTLGQCLGQKLVGVKGVAAQGHKQIPRPGAAGVGVHAQPGARRVGAELAVGNQLGQMAQRHAGCGARLQRLAGMDPVVKSVALPGHFLAGLVALACDQHQVTVMRLQHGVGDRGSAAGFDMPR